MIMKGLEEYIKRHGRHLTERLALDSTVVRWDAAKVRKAVEGRAYYNVTGFTVGDMVYLVNEYHARYPRPHKAQCIKYILRIVEDVAFEGKAFDDWLAKGSTVDLGRYI